MTTESACTPSESYVANALDCDDDDATVYSGASELCDRQINNCVTELFLPMKVMTMVMASSNAIDVGGWDGALATGGDVTMETPARKYQDSDRIATVIQ